MVKVDGYTGRVDEIRMTFVLIRSWDERLITVPTGRFFEQSFENWSRKNERLTGPVFLHLDPATPIAPIREEFKRFLASHELRSEERRVGKECVSTCRFRCSRSH